MAPPANKKTFAMSLRVIAFIGIKRFQYGWVIELKNLSLDLAAIGVEPQAGVLAQIVEKSANGSASYESQLTHHFGNFRWSGFWLEGSVDKQIVSSQSTVFFHQARFHMRPAIESYYENNINLHGQPGQAKL